MSSSEPDLPTDYRSTSTTGTAGSEAPSSQAPAARPSGAAAGHASHRSSDTPFSRSWSDVLVGGILVGTGLVVLADVAVASVISVQFLGWTLIIGGAIGIALALWQAGRSGFWIGLLGGVLALVAGLVMVRHPEATLVALSAAIGALMLINGIIRLGAAVQHRGSRTALIVSGLFSLLLGVLIFAQWPTSALWLIGTLLGVQLLLDGLALIVVGRPWASA
jgi:uncharacterized membrane protein HdeD (DUF308 family)